MKYIVLILALLLALCGCSDKVSEESQEQISISENSEIEVIPSDIAEENVPVEEPESQNEEIPEELPAAISLLLPDREVLCPFLQLSHRKQHKDIGQEAAGRSLWKAIPFQAV